MNHPDHGSRPPPGSAEHEAPSAGAVRGALGAFEIESALFRALAKTDRAFIAVGTSGVVLFWSAGAEALLGRRAEDVVGQNLRTALPELEQALSARRDAVHAGGVVSCELSLGTGGSAASAFSVLVAPAFNEAGDVIAALVLLSRSHGFRGVALTGSGPPLSSVDERAAFVHDLNNILATVESYATFVGREPMSARQTEDLRVVRDAARRGAKLTAQWLGSAPASRTQPLRVDLGEVVRGADALLRHVVGAGVALALRLPPSPLFVQAAPADIEQVLFGLATNARDAMGGVGSLTVSLHCATAASLGDAVSSAPGVSFAVLTVADTGTGMSKDVQSRIFEPFFTHKPRGEGNGLGLPVVQHLVQSMGGGVRVESELGRGSQFLIFLPLLDGAPTEADALPEVPGKTVLVVEDDSIMRGGLRRMLQAEGYRVLEAADGIEAADLAARYLEPIHVFVSDLLMPRADGRDAFDRVRVSRPDIRAVFVSGRKDTNRALPEGAEFVQKPFATSELVAAVARVIEAGPPDAGRLLSPNPVVLVVDDDEELRSAFVRVIEECEFVALPAKSGLHALKVLGERHVDVVISDHFMPGMDGVRLLELVRLRFGHCIRVLFTAHPSSDIVLEAVNRGGVHKVLVKSMHAVAIRDEIERAVLQSDRFRHRPRA